MQSQEIRFLLQLDESFYISFSLFDFIIYASDYLFLENRQQKARNDSFYAFVNLRTKKVHSLVLNYFLRTSTLKQPKTSILCVRFFYGIK